MKKLFVSVGLATVGTASLHAVYAPDMGTSMAATKMWTVSATLRGFFDDNYTTSGSEHGSYGFEFSPSFGLNVPLQQTELGMRYTYGLYYYQDRQEGEQDPIDMTHQLDLWVAHAFTERWQARVEDTFDMAQEPELLSQGGAVATPLRVGGNNIANTGVVTVNTDWTRLFSTVFTYRNRFADYENSGVNAAQIASGQPASLAGSLNRIEHLLSLDFQFHLAPLTTVLFGYQYGQVNYTGDEPVAVVPAPAPPPLPVSGFTYVSSSRNSLSHYGYVGVQHAILANLSLSAKVGAQYTDNYNDPLGTTSFGPYADASLSYTYLPGSYAQIGVNHTRNATDAIALNSKNGSITMDQESTVVYGSINHGITPKLMASIIANIQFSKFKGGSIDSQSETIYSTGLNLNYVFTPHVSAEVGYNFDHDDSKVVGRSYFRHRVYVGVTGKY